MVAPAKRKRESVPAASTSTATPSTKTPLPEWPELLAGIQGSKGEPGAILALHQLCRVLNSQAAVTSGAAKKSANTNDPNYQIWTSFLSYWECDAGLKDVVAVWERGDQSGNSALTIAALSTYSTLLSLSTVPSAGIISLGSPYQTALSTCIQELIKLLHYLTKYLNSPGKNDLTTAALELIAALLKIVRYAPARNATSRKIWQALNLDSKVICRLLGTKRKIPHVTKHGGRRPDIRHLMLSILLTLLAPSSSISIKTDVLQGRGIISSIWKTLAEDPREVVESVLECTAFLVGTQKLPMEIRCRLAEDSWSEVLKLYERMEDERDPSTPADESIYPPAISAHRYLLYVITALSKSAPHATPSSTTTSNFSSHSSQNTLSPTQKRVLGALLGLLQISDSEEQGDIALHVLSSAPEMLPSFWARFAPSLEPRLSSRWVTSVGFAGRVVGAPVNPVLNDILEQVKIGKTEQQDKLGRRRKLQVPNLSLLTDSALMPASLGKTWLSKALQTNSTTPLVSFLACNFLYIGLRKCSELARMLREIGDALGGGTAGEAWYTAAGRIKQDAKERIPELQVLIALVQNGLGRAFSRAGSVASTTGSIGDTSAVTEDGEPVQDNNTLLISLALRTIQIYHTIVPSAFSNLRFDFGRLLNSSFFTDSSKDPSSIPIAALGQAALLELVSSPGDLETGEGAITWSWSKSSEGSLSPLASIISIYLSTPLESLRTVAEKTVKNLLSSSLLFEHDPEEAGLWLAALPRSNLKQQEESLVFLDNCIQRCLQTPFKYIDQLHSLLETNNPDCPNQACRSTSPLLAVVLEQLKYRFGKQEDATPYAVFVQRLMVALLGHNGCTCLVDSITQRVLEDVGDQKGHQQAALEAVQVAADYVNLVKSGNGGKAAKPLQYEEADGKDPLSLLCAMLETLAREGLADVQKQMSDTDSGTIANNILPLARICLHVLANRGAEVESAISLLDFLLEKTGPSNLAVVKRVVFESSQLLASLETCITSKQNAVAAIADFLAKRLWMPSDEYLLRPYTAILLDRMPAQAFGKLANVVSNLPKDQLIPAFRKISQDANSKDLLARLCERLTPLVSDKAISASIIQSWQTFYDIGEPGIGLLAALAESYLPTGIRSSTAVHIPSERTSPSQQDLQQFIQIAKKVLLTPPEDLITFAGSRVAAAGLYLGLSAQLVEQGLTVHEAPYAAQAPLYLASLEVAIATGNTPNLQDFDYSDLVSAFLDPSRGNKELRSFTASIMLQLQEVSPNAPSAANKQLEAKLPAAALATPAIFDKLSVETLAKMAKASGSVESFAILESLVNESLRWLVRRLAEDEENTAQVEEFITSLEPCLRANTGRWLLKPHLVEPVITAGIQNRLTSSSTLSFLATLTQESKLQLAPQTRLVQAILADSRFRTGLTPISLTRTQLLRLVEAFHRHSPELLGQLGAFPTLLAYYQATLSESDQILLRIFRLAELRGSVSIRGLVRSWIPPQLRGTANGSFQVLAAMNPEGLHNACVHVLRRETLAEDASREGANDPSWFLPLLATSLDSEEISRTSWLALAESNMLGLAVCALSSSNKQYQLAGDRLLAKARNALQSAEFKEKDEMLFILDGARNLILPSSTVSSTPIPPLIALFLAQALKRVATPGTSEYPLTWRFLLARPLVDTKDVPLFYNLFYSSSDDSDRERRWLLKMLTEGTHTSDDWRILRRRQAIDLFLTYLQSSVADDKPEIRMDILHFFRRVTSLPSAVQDLVSRNGFFGSISLLAPKSPEESLELVRIIDNCVSGVQPTKLRRARDGLWVMDALKALEAAWTIDLSSEGINVVCHTLRRLMVYLAHGQETAINIAGPLLAKFSRKALTACEVQSGESQKEAVRNLYDTIVRLDYAWRRETSEMGHLLEDSTTLALGVGLEGVKEEVLRCWHTRSA